jgi:hypothetical protein
MSINTVTDAIRHHPAGSPKGGQFMAKEGGDSGGDQVNVGTEKWPLMANKVESLPSKDGSFTHKVAGYSEKTDSLAVGKKVFSKTGRTGTSFKENAAVTEWEADDERAWVDPKGRMYFDSAAHLFSDAAPLTGVRRTEDGYLVGRVRAARTGTQLYTRKELQLDGDGTIVVYRPPEAVFDANSISSYAGKPITMGHPKAGVSAASWKDLAVGSVGSKVLRDGESVVVDFSIMDAAAISAIEQGTREVSMGYSTPMELRDGIAPDGTPYQAVQTGPIKINHLAVVPVARGGSELRIGDSAETWGASPLNHKEPIMTTKVVVLGDAAVTVAVTDAPAVEAFRDSMLKKLADAEADKKKMAAEKDEELGALKAEKKALEDAAITPAKLTKMIADRVALESEVKQVSDSIVCDGLSDNELKKAAVVARLGDAAVVDASPAEINGMFRAITRSAAVPDDTARQALRGRPIYDAASAMWNDSIAERAGVSFKKKGA